MKYNKIHVYLKGVIFINYIKLKLKIKKFKDVLIRKWYRLMRPLANLIEKIENRKYRKFCTKAESMNTDTVVKRAARLILSELIRRERSLEFEIAERTVYDEDGKTILEYASGQYKDKKLKHWSYRVKNPLAVNNHVAKELVEYFSKNNSIIVETYINKDYEEYRWRMPKEYLYTLKISLNKNYK